MPTALRSLDDKVLGDRGRRRQPTAVRRGDWSADAEPYPEERRTEQVHREPADEGPKGDGVKAVLAVVARISKLVFLLLALIVVIGTVFVLAPTNMDNVLVENGLELAETVAGPFKDVFTADDAETQTVVNYALAAAVYLLAASLVSKLPSLKR